MVVPDEIQGKDVNNETGPGKEVDVEEKAHSIFSLVAK